MTLTPLQLKVIDLFSGAGGFSEGMRQAGHEIILAVDNWEVALKSHEANHPEAEHWNTDILKLKPEDLPKADILIGSPPCQEFSTVNKNRPKTPDLSMVKHFLTLTADFKYSIGENVPLIRPHINGLNYQTLEARQFGLWHKRPRVFFGNFPRVKMLTRNPVHFPTPRAANRNTSTQISLLNKIDKPKHLRKKYLFELSYPPHVAQWIMGFPENYTFLGTKAEQSRQIGNAVCPPVAKAIGEAIAGVRQ